MCYSVLTVISVLSIIFALRMSSDPGGKSSGFENGKAWAVDVKSGLCVTWGRGQTRQGQGTGEP